MRNKRNVSLEHLTVKKQVLVDLQRQLLVELAKVPSKRQGYREGFKASINHLEYQEKLVSKLIYSRNRDQFKPGEAQAEPKKARPLAWLPSIFKGKQ